MRKYKTMSLPQLHTELKTLQDDLSSYKENSRAAAIRRLWIEEIKSEIERRKPLPEISQRLKAWRGNRGLKEITDILSKSFGEDIAPSTLGRIESGKLNNRNCPDGFEVWLESFLIEETKNMNIDFEAPQAPDKPTNRWFG